MNLNMNVSENPYYIDENYFNTLKSFHLTDVGYEGRYQYLVLLMIMINELQQRNENENNVFFIKAEYKCKRFV